MKGKKINLFKLAELVQKSKEYNLVGNSDSQLEFFTHIIIEREGTVFMITSKGKVNFLKIPSLRKYLELRELLNDFYKKYIFKSKPRCINET